MYLETFNKFSISCGKGTCNYAIITQNTSTSGQIVNREREREKENERVKENEKERERERVRGRDRETH